MHAASRRDDPYSNFNFIIEFGGMKAGFSDVNGLPEDTACLESRSSPQESTARKLLGIRKFTNLTLKRGYTNSKDLWDWYESARGGKARPLTGTITVFDETRAVISSWKLSQVWPEKVKGPDFNAKSNEVAIEELEIRVEGLSRRSPSDDPKP